MATYYKVVRVNRKGEYHSAVITGKARLRYIIGERTMGFEGMPVLMFRDKGRAHEFAHVNLREEMACVLAGKAGTPRRQDIICGAWRGLLGFRAFWKGETSPSLQDRPAPDGTYAADWFTPERVV